MEIIEREIYEDILYECGFSKIKYMEMHPIDIYHADNWDHFTKNWDSEENSCTTTYMEFFFAAKKMTDFLKLYIKNFKNKSCYFAPVIKCGYSLYETSDDVSNELYYSIKKLLNSKKLKVNTSKVLKFNEKELFELLDIWSCAGFVGVSDYSIFFREEQTIITPHHHMNYLIYSNDKQRHIMLLNNIINNVENSILLYS